MPQFCVKPIRTFSNNEYIVKDNIVELPISTSRVLLTQRIEELCKANRGLGLTGMLNPNIIGELFRDMSNKWKKLATLHIKAVWKAIKEFLESVLPCIAGWKTKNVILADYINPRMDSRLKHSIQKLEEILTPFTKFHPITYSRGLAMNRSLMKLRQEQKQKEDGKEKMKRDPLDTIQSSLRCKPDDEINRKWIDPDRKHGASEILDTTLAYYDVSGAYFSASLVFWPAY